MSTNAVVESCPTNKNKEVQLKTAGKLWPKMFGSTTFWIVFSFITLNCFLLGVNIIPLLDAKTLPPMQSTKAAVAFKLKQYKKLPNAPDILFLGSSLPLHALFHSENGQFSQRNSSDVIADNVNFLQTYTSCNFFEKTLEKKMGHRPDVFNFTVFACMLSDIELIWSKINDTNTIPKKVILGVGLRSFQDNVNPKFGQTPAFKQLIDINYLANNFYQFLAQDLTVVRDMVLTSGLPVWKNRIEFKLLAEALFTDFLDKDTSFAMKQTEYKTKQKEKIKNSTNSKPEFLTSLKELDYQVRYNPPNMNQFASEFRALNRLLKKFNSKNIEVTIVNMPVSQGNKLISSPEQRSLYIQKLQKLSTQNNANYIDFEYSTDFKNADFSDTVHLNSQGASKFLIDLVQQLNLKDKEKTQAQQANLKNL